MKIQRIWHSCCLLFCIYCLVILMDEQYEVTYLDDSRHEATRELQYLWCVPLKSLSLNGTVMQLSELSETLKESFEESFSQNDPKRFEFDRWFEEANTSRTFVLERASSPDHLLILSEMACLILFGEEEKYLAIRAFVPRDLKAPKKQPRRVLECEWETYDWSTLDDDQGIDRLIVINEPQPYSNCTDGYSRFRCVNECIKRQFRLSKYMYFGNETGPIYLDRTNNKTVRSHEASCFRKCTGSNCKIVYLSQRRRWLRRGEVYIFKAQPIIGRFDFAIQLLGLVLLIIDVSIWQLLTIAIALAKLKFPTRSVRIAAICLKLSLLLVGLLWCSYMFTQLILDYQSRLKNPSRKETTMNLFKPPELVRLVVCVPIASKNEDSSYNFSGIESDPTMLQIELATQGKLNETLDSILLDYRDKSRETNWNITEQVMFRLNVNTNFLERCFQLAIEPIEPLYQRLLAISKLKIRFKNESFKLYLLTEHENFNSKSFECIGKTLFLKSVVKRSRLNGKCIDYAAEHLDLKCTTRMDCIERCAQREFFESQQNVTVESSGNSLMIHKDQFSAEDWKTVYLVKNDEVSRAIIRSCMKEIPNVRRCLGVRYEIDSQISQPDKLSTEIELYYKVVSSVEEEPSFYKLLLELLNSQGIFFGLTIYGVLQLTTTCKFLRSKLICKFTREPAKIRSLTDLVCLAGLVWHTSFIVDEILHAELSYSQHFEITEHVSVPEVLLCVDSLNISWFATGHRLTPNDLEERTKNVSIERIFESIAYLDTENDWVELKSNFSSELLKIENIFFLLKKCFSFQLNLNYDLSQFFFSGSHEKHNEVIRLKLHKEFIAERRTLHFITYRAMQFSKMLGLTKFASGRCYSIMQEPFLFRLIDRFVHIKNFFRDPIGLFLNYNDINDVNVYIIRLLNAFRNTYKKVSLNLPIPNNLSNMEIDDSAFDEYFFKHDLKTPLGVNFEREYATNLMRSGLCSRDRNHTDPHISFGLIPFRKVGFILKDS